MDSIESFIENIKSENLPEFRKNRGEDEALKLVERLCEKTEDSIVISLAMHRLCGNNAVEKVVNCIKAVEHLNNSRNMLIKLRG